MVVKIVVNDKDISADFKKYFLDLQIIDKDGTESDELNFTISYAIKRPQYEDKIKIWIDDVFYGTFLVQSTSTNHIQELTVRATGTNFSSTIKSKKSRNFSDTNLNEIVQKISKENGLKPKVDFKDVSISNVIQSKESDMHFLSRMAKENNAIFSVKNNTLLFLERSTKLPTFTIDLKKVSAWNITHTNTKTYSSCRAKYRTTKDNKTNTITIGEGTPVLEFEEFFSNSEEAKRKATAKLQKANRGTKEGYLSTKGFYLSAGSKITLRNSAQDNGEYTAQTVTTSININTGWITDIDFSN
jgi:phage protein D